VNLGLGNWSFSFFATLKLKAKDFVHKHLNHAPLRTFAENKEVNSNKIPQKNYFKIRSQFINN
jgi:hypothetical protein